MAGCIPFGSAGATKMLAAAALQEIHGQGEEIPAGSRQAAPGAAQLRAVSPRRGWVGLRGAENRMLACWGARASFLVPTEVPGSCSGNLPAQGGFLLVDASFSRALPFHPSSFLKKPSQNAHIPLVRSPRALPQLCCWEGRSASQAGVLVPGAAFPLIARLSDLGQTLPRPGLWSPAVSLDNNTTFAGCVL